MAAVLSQLSIENIAVIQHTEINFKDGFHVFTGETGAGKTILVNAINMVLGGRTSKEIIRTGESRARVAALFTDIPCKAAALIDQLGFPVQDAQILVQRDIDITGKGSCRIDGRPATTGLLRTICSLLIDIHGQHDNQELLSSEKHIGFLDSFGDYNTVLLSYRDAYDRMTQCREKLDAMQMDESYKLQRMDILSFQMKEIGDAALTDGEEEILTEQQKRIKNAERITEALGCIYDLLHGAEMQSGILEQLEKVSDAMDRAGQYISTLREYDARLSDAYYTLEDLANTARDTLEDADFDPRKLDAIESRLDIIYRLKKKYGTNIAEILAYYDKIEEEYNSLKSSDELLEKLQAVFAAASEEANAAAALLSQKRREAGLHFKEQVEQELTYLDMAGVRFSIQQEQKELSANGCDEIRFLISTNAGEDARPLAKIASGGELARIMLAIKNVLADKDDIGTIIFDEVDTGVSGRAAQKIGIKLAEVARHRQVICVTHLAAVAACADHHYRIYKTVEEGRTYTQVDQLKRAQRVQELARIMVGENITSSALQSAEEMLGANS